MRLRAGLAQVCLAFLLVAAASALVRGPPSKTVLPKNSFSIDYGGAVKGAFPSKAGWSEGGNGLTTFGKPEGEKEKCEECSREKCSRQCLAPVNALGATECETCIHFSCKCDYIQRRRRRR